MYYFLWICGFVFIAIPTFVVYVPVFVARGLVGFINQLIVPVEDWVNLKSATILDRWVKFLIEFKKNNGL